MLRKNALEHTAPCTGLCGHPYVGVYCFSYLCECKCALHGPLRSADFGFIMANMMQHFILPAVRDMVLSVALFGIKT